MKITDHTIIDALIESSGCIQDGLTVFVGQGRIAIDVCLHSDTHDSTDLYVFDVYKRKTECEDTDTFFNFTYMNSAAFEEFEEKFFIQEYYTTIAEVHARITELMIEYSAFN
jgi:hypothetical protein